jgi:hypothetical protein
MQQVGTELLIENSKNYTGNSYVAMKLLQKKRQIQESPSFFHFTLSI